jgi:hypothetical protein
MIFPLLIGKTGVEPAFSPLPDIGLELVHQSVLDNRIVLSEYHPSGAPPYAADDYQAPARGISYTSCRTSPGTGQTAKPGVARILRGRAMALGVRTAGSGLLVP